MIVEFWELKIGERFKTFGGEATFIKSQKQTFPNQDYRAETFGVNLETGYARSFYSFDYVRKQTLKEKL